MSPAIASGLEKAIGLLDAEYGAYDADEAKKHKKRYKTYRVTSRSLRKWNRLRSSRIRLGQKLVVKKPVPLCRRRTFHYRIKKGDTLLKIAKRYKVSVRQIKRWNKLRSSVIRKNQRLLIYTKKTKRRVHKITYVVKRGEYKWQHVANKHGMSVKAAEQWMTLLGKFGAQFKGGVVPEQVVDPTAVVAGGADVDQAVNEEPAVDVADMFLAGG